MSVNAVERLCFETAGHYEAAASELGEDHLAHVFSALADERQRLAGDLAVQIRALDDLPQQPDPDREAMSHMLSGIKALLSRDMRGTLVADCERGEEALLSALHAALRQDLPEEMQEVLRRILAHAESAQRELSAIH
ncbi:hypothetical protein AYR66_07145 [Noviherbaspirillum denitrificans]|uniref:DUF2383 domain-containing protein n=2 Tax=Noviherbaspirillum denitrificans TaxID=1968433 RepID=A0A254T9G1_9BURK|nr:hypothetical protein AYR66_07145 [Noviherbaspirillum denitrificans]